MEIIFVIIVIAIAFIIIRVKASEKTKKNVRMYNAATNFINTFKPGTEEYFIATTTARKIVKHGFKYAAEEFIREARHMSPERAIVVHSVLVKAGIQRGYTM